jgi:hypothetical protein
MLTADSQVSLPAPSESTRILDDIREKEISMNDQTPSSDDTTPDLEAAPAAPAEPTASEAPAPADQTTASVRPRRTRELMAAGAAGMLVVGGLAGFGIGRATGGDGPHFNRNGQFRPGQQGYGRPGQRGPGGFGGQGNAPQQGSGQEGQPNGQSGSQPSDDGPGSDGT